MNYFILDDYKKILRARVEELKVQNKRFTFQSLADHCRVQKTYLSRVLGSHKTHLSSDQLELGLDFLGFNVDERQYVFLVYEKQRTVLTSRRERLAIEIEQIRKQRLKSESHLNAPKNPSVSVDWTDYYLDPFHQLVHVFLTIPKYAACSELIRTQLNLPKRRFDGILKRLLKMGVIGLSAEGYTVLQQRMHLPSDSPLLGPYRTLLRMKALDRMQKLSADDAYTFSVVFSASPKERKWIQSEFLNLLKRIENTVGRAPAQEVYQMSFDLFDWSAGE